MAKRSDKARPGISLVQSKTIGRVLLRKFSYFGKERYLWETSLTPDFIVVAVLSKDMKPIGLAVNYRTTGRKDSGFLIEYANIVSAPSDPSLLEIMSTELVRGATNQTSVSKAASKTVNWKSAREYLLADRAVRVTVPEDDRPVLPTSPPAIARFKFQDMFCGRTAIDSVGACFWPRACRWAKCIDDAIATGTDATECRGAGDRALECFGVDPHG